MCRLRQVCNVYTKCGHKVPQPDEEIHCDSPNCRFSPSHPPNCTYPQCRQTCTQQRRWPEQYSPHLDRFCPSCQRHYGYA